MKIRGDAVYADYMSAKYDAAADKLNQALGLCGGSGCSPATRARLHCDLGVVYCAQGRSDLGTAQFVAALHDDPDVALDNDLTTVDIQKIFAAAKAKAGGKTESAPTST